MKKKIAILTLLATSTFAIDINEAIQRGVQNSNVLKQQLETTNIATYSKEQQFASFLPTIDTSYSYYDRDTQRLSDNKKDSTASLIVSYNLFNGLSDSNLYEASKKDEEVAILYLQSAKEDIVLQIKTAYVDYLSAKENLNIQKESLNLLKKQFEDTKMLYKQGMLAKNDLLKVEVELLSIEQKLNKAISELKIARLSLIKLIGEFDTEPENILTSIEDINFERLTEDMYKNRSELKALTKAKESLQYKKTALNSTAMPKLDLTTSFVQYGDETRPNGRGNSELYDDEKTIGMTMKWNLYNGGKDELAKKKYISQILSNDAQVDEMKKKLSLQLAKAYEEYSLAVSNLKISQKAKESAKENYKIVENQFKEGLAKTSDRLDAREYLTRANSEYNIAYFDAITSLYTIQRISQSK